MTQSEYDRFAELIAAEADVHRAPLSPGSLRVYWSALRDMSLDQVAQALLAHERNPDRGQYMPTPADIRREYLSSVDDGRPGPEEAWGIAVRLMSQEATVVVTDDIMCAWDVARPICEIGDRIGGRKAFLEKYQSLATHGPVGRVRWWPSLGHDPAGREAAIAEAVHLGRLRAEDAARYLPYHDTPALAGAMLVAAAGRRVKNDEHS